MNGNVTIKAIAESLGVSFSTVSKCLNNSPAVSDKTKSMVLERANKMGYVPNVQARALRKHTANIISILFNDIENPVLTYIFKHISVNLAKMDYTTLISDSQFSVDTERSTIISMLSYMPAFSFLAPASIDSIGQNLELFEDKNLVIFDKIDRNTNFSYIDVDYEHGGYISALELISNGHKKIIVITEPLDYPFSSYYVKGIKRAFEENNLPFEDDCLYFTHSSVEESRKITLDAYSKAKQNPKKSFTAALCFGDNFALGVYKAVSQLGYTVPNDLSVIGFDNNEYAEYTTPPLTTVHLPKEKMADYCIDLLKSYIEKGTTDRVLYSLLPSLISRNSVKFLKNGR